MKVHNFQTGHNRFAQNVSKVRSLMYGILFLRGIMDVIVIIKNLTGQILVFAQAKPLIALAVLLILAYLIYRKPLFFFSVFVLGLILTGVLFVIFSISSSGVSEKERLIQKESEPENNFRTPGIMLGNQE